MMGLSPIISLLKGKGSIMIRDRLLAVLTIMVGIIMYTETYTFARKASWQLVGPEVFPRVLIVIIVLLSLILLIQSFFTKHPETKKFELQEFLNKNGKSIIIFIIFGIYVFLLSRVHFIISTLLFLFTTQALLTGVKKSKLLIRNLIVTLVATFSIYIIFTNILSIWLP